MKKKLTFSDKIKISGFHKQLKDIISDCINVFKNNVSISIENIYRKKNLCKDPSCPINFILDNFRAIDNFIFNLALIKENIEYFNDQIRKNFDKVERYLSSRKLAFLNSAIYNLNSCNSTKLLYASSYGDICSLFDSYLDKCSNLDNSKCKAVFKKLKDAFAFKRIKKTIKYMEDFFTNDLFDLYLEADKRVKSKKNHPELRALVAKPSDFIKELNSNDLKQLHEKCLTHAKWLKCLNLKLVENLLKFTKDLKMKDLTVIGQIYLQAVSLNLDGDCMLPAQGTNSVHDELKKLGNQNEKALLNLAKAQIQNRLKIQKSSYETTKNEIDKFIKTFNDFLESKKT